MELRASRMSKRLPRSLPRLFEIGALPSDSEELRVRKAVLVLSSTLMTTLASVWVGTYAALGLWASAAIPFAYQLASAASIAVFARTKRYMLFRESQLLLSLMLPFVLQWSLGGFEASSAVSLWAFTCPLGALLFVGARDALPWFLAFAGLVVVSAAIDGTVAEHAADVPEAVVVTFFALNVLGVAATTYALLQYFVRARERALAESERLLLNVLPAPVAARLKAHDGILAEDCPAVTVLFADLVGFTPLAERLPAAEVVALLDRVFARWDAVVAEHGVEKIKTLGDAYMVAGGVPLARDDHAEAIAAVALAMGPALARCAAEVGLDLDVRIGIDSGTAVAGVIGRSKFIYDLWGDTVNTASRMESHAEPGTIQVTERAYERLRHGFELRRRGAVEVKGKGPMECYVLVGARAESAPTPAMLAASPASDDDGRRSPGVAPTP
jgi:adenylate cyclase